MQSTYPLHNTFPEVPDVGFDLYPIPAMVHNAEVNPEGIQAHQPTITTDPHPLAADQKLHRIIRFGNKYDLPKLIDETISEGAQLNHLECYECNSLVVAVRANNFHAISPLLVRGAQLPVHDANKIDLLMEACRTGDVNTAIELVKVAKISLKAQDATGKTALHYAVIGGSQELTLLLLSGGADPNAEAHQMTEFESTTIFGPGIHFKDLAVTPLMIAARLGDDYLTHLLLNHGANANRGACSPLIIAAFSGKPDIFRRLLSAGATLDQCRDYRGYTGLSACIVSRMPIQYLSQLISNHDFSTYNGSVLSPLGLAVERKLYDAVSLLLASGASIESHETTDEPTSIWQAALPNGCYGSPMADLLIAKNPLFIHTHAAENIANQFLWMVSKLHQPEVLASNGCFTSTLFTSSEKIKYTLLQRPDLTDCQKSLIVASIFCHSLPETSLPAPLKSGQPVPTHVIWQHYTRRQIHLQREALKLASTTLVGHAMQKLAETVSATFFQELAKRFPKNVAIGKFIHQHLQESLGIPAVIAKRIGDAWHKAARLSVGWQIEPEKKGQVLESLARNLLRKEADVPLMDADTLIFSCKTALDAALPLASQPLHQFHCDPVAWLYKLENRTSLADPGPDLAYQCQIELGLPFATCDAIAKAWQQSIQSTREAPWQRLPQLLKILNRDFAHRITDSLADELTQEIISDIDNLMLQTWLKKIQSPEPPQPTAAEELPPGAVGRKRPAEQEAPDAPPSKEPRT